MREKTYDYAEEDKTERKIPSDISPEKCMKKRERKA